MRIAGLPLLDLVLRDMSVMARGVMAAAAACPASSHLFLLWRIGNVEALDEFNPEQVGLTIPGQRHCTAQIKFQYLQESPSICIYPFQSHDTQSFMGSRAAGVSGGGVALPSP